MGGRARGGVPLTESGVARLLDTVRDWAPGRPDLCAVALVGSRARGTARPDSDVGIVAPAWACTDPLDPGTARVVAGGLVALHDPDGLLRELAQAGSRSAMRP